MAWGLAVLVGLAASYACLLAWGLVGVLTYVVAMCSDAPEWWSITYLWLSLLALAPGFLAARGSFRWFVTKARYKLHAKNSEEHHGT